MFNNSQYFFPHVSLDGKLLPTIWTSTPPLELEEMQKMSSTKPRTCRDWVHAIILHTMLLVLVELNKLEWFSFWLIDEPPVLFLPQILCRRTRSTEKPSRSLRRNTTRSRPLSTTLCRRRDSKVSPSSLGEVCWGDTKLPNTSNFKVLNQQSPRA